MVICQKKKLFSVLLFLAIAFILPKRAVVYANDESWIKPEEEKIIRKILDGKELSVEDEKVWERLFPWKLSIEEKSAFRKTLKNDPKPVLSEEERKILEKLYQRVPEKERQSFEQKAKDLAWKAGTVEVHGAFFVKGVVTDKKGNKLSDVQVRIGKTISPLPFVFNDEFEEKKINSDFRFDIKGGMHIHLTFEKNGYYSEEFYFSQIPPYATPETVQFRKERGKIIVDNLEVKLEEFGRIVKLINCEYRLKYKSSGEGLIIGLEKNDKYPFMLYKKENLDNSMQFPEHCIYFTAKKDSSGRIAIIETNQANNWPSLKEVRVKMKSPLDGFVIYQPKDEKNPDREMKEAPEEGYQQEMIISGESKLGTFHEPLRFYFRMNGKYGKGKINFNYYKGKDNFPKEVTGFISLSLQPDGSRYLKGY